MIDELLDALANVHRRRLVVSLLEEDSVNADRFVSQEIEYGERERDRLSIGLYHVHLPKLEAVGFVDWDRDTGTVARGPNFQEFRPLVECLDDHAADLFDEWT